MDQRAFSLGLFLLGLLALILSAGAIFFDLTQADDWLAYGMIAFGLILSLVSFFMLMSGDSGGSLGLQGRMYGVLLFLYGLATLILSLVAVFGGYTIHPERAVIMAITSLGICLLSAIFLSGSE